jgi:nucleoid DNA-binding protein
MAAKKKAATKKKTTARAPAKPPTKTEIIAHIADEAGLTRKQASDALESLHGLIKKNIGRRGPGEFTGPGLIKIKKVTKAATKSRPGVNPFTGENIIIKAKPARKVVKVTPLKALKDMV